MTFGSNRNEKESYHFYAIPITSFEGGMNLSTRDDEDTLGYQASQLHALEYICMKHSGEEKRDVKNSENGAEERKKPGKR